jgi:hypothetical protein
MEGGTGSAIQILSSDDERDAPIEISSDDGQPESTQVPETSQLAVKVRTDIHPMLNGADPGF